MSATPSSYSITMRLHTAPDHGVVGAVATAIATAGGIVTAIDVADSSHVRLVVDVTCSAADAEHAEVLVRAVHQPIVDELRRRGTPYHGVLYAGLMMTADGPRVLEYNCRFGDPETQAVLPRLRSDLLELLQRSTSTGGLAGYVPAWSSDWAVTVVLASRGYPASSSKGDEISGLEAIDSLDLQVFHAGTAEQGGKIVTAGGRVLNVTGLGAGPGEARERAYEAAERIDFDGKQMRTDIGARAVERVHA
jgi:phosphoribosylamine--glycine ligase